MCHVPSRSCQATSAYRISPLLVNDPRRPDSHGVYRPWSYLCRKSYFQPAPKRHDGVLKRPLVKANARWETKKTGDAAAYYIGSGPYLVLRSRIFDHTD